MVFRIKKGFTLVELLVVVAILGVLAAVGIVSFGGFLKSTKENTVKANHVNKQYANIGLQYAPDTQYTNTKPTPEDGKRYNWTYVNESKTHVILGKNTCAICNDIISFTKAAKIFDMELVVCIEGDVTKYYYNTTNSAHDNTTNRESDDTTNSEAHDDTTNREPDEDYDAFLYKLHLT